MQITETINFFLKKLSNKFRENFTEIWWEDELSDAQGSGARHGYAAT